MLFNIPFFWKNHKKSIKLPRFTDDMKVAMIYKDFTYLVCVVMYILLPTYSSLIFFIVKFFANFAPEIYDFKFQPIWRIFHGK